MALCDKFRHCETFSKKNFVPHPPARIVIMPADIFYTCGYFIKCADRDLDVKRLCNSLKNLIRMYKNGQTIKTIIKTYKCMGFVCIPSSSTILFG